MKFKAKTIKQEYSLISKDDSFFTKTKEYLKPLILTAIGRFELDEKNRNELFWNLINDIPIAAKRYLENKNTEKKYKFSTYFTWYIAQRINKIKKLKKK